MAKVKAISPENQEARLAYGREHKDKTVEDFWQYVHWTDEAHIDPSAEPRQWILREEGTRLSPDNIQEMKELKGVKFHHCGISFLVS